MITTVAPTVTHGLADDHARLDLLLDEALRATDPADARLVFTALAIGLKRHMEIEERLLFPASRLVLAGPTTVMLHEHRAIDELLARADRLHADGDLAAYARHTQALKTLLQAHNLKEERVLYPRTEEAMSQSERAALIAALRLS